MPCPKEIRLTSLIVPTFHILKESDGSCDIETITQSLITKLSLSDSIVDLLHRGRSSETELDYQLAWVKTYFRKIGLIEPTGNLWVLTPGSSELTDEDVQEKVREFRAAINRKANAKHSKNKPEKSAAEPEENTDFEDLVAPDPLDWKTRLSDVLKNMNPYAFERLSRRLIQECGFTHVTVTKKSGDGGIDGYGKLKINGIFTFNVAFQCKRYSGTVPTSDIRDFRGSLTTDIEKGIFITTGKFSNEAQKEACDKGKKQIDLMDGDEFMNKIAEYGIGVRPVTTYEIDEEFFEKI